jgi:hypothetical protein
MKMKDGIINEKETEIDRLRKELHSRAEEQNGGDKTFEIKKLLEVINKMSEENNCMKARLREYEIMGEPPKGRDFLL